MSQSNSVISTKKLTSNVAGYIWDSPCLKPIIYNPFILAFLILTIIWVIDFIYGKGFYKESISITIQHIATTYVLVAMGIAMNNMLIKHRYRLDRVEDKKIESTEPIVSTYASDDDHL